MRRAKIVVGTALALVGLATFGMTLYVLHERKATYAMLGHDDLDRNSAAVIFLISGSLILTSARRR